MARDLVTGGERILNVACEESLVEWERNGQVNAEGGVALREAIRQYRAAPSVNLAAAVASTLWDQGMQSLLMGSRPGAWSHVRRSAGPTWSSLATTTRALTRRASQPRGGSRMGETPSPPLGLGCMGVVGDDVWIADHLFYEVQLGLEIATDATWYGMEGDPDVADFAGLSGTFERWQRRWIERLGGKPRRSGWLCSSRWLIPVPAHAIPRKALADSVGEKLWRQACVFTSLIPTWIADEPTLWWREENAALHARDLATVISEGSPPTGTLSLDAMARRQPRDVAAIPLFLRMAGRGEREPDRCFMHLLTLLLKNQLADWDGIIRNENENRFCHEKPLGQSTAKAMCWTVNEHRIVNTWMICSLFAPLLPSIFNLNLNDLFPPASLLRAGIGRVLQRLAVPCAQVPGSQPNGRTEITDINHVCWVLSGPTKHLPEGFMSIPSESMDRLLQRPSSIEVGGSGLIYDGKT